jgi:hypothetical protein
MAQSTQRFIVLSYVAVGQTWVRLRIPPGFPSLERKNQGRFIPHLQQEI